jgi:hypothetical protein
MVGFFIHTWRKAFLYLIFVIVCSESNVAESGCKFKSEKNKIQEFTFNFFFVFKVTEDIRPFLNYTSISLYTRLFLITELNMTAESNLIRIQLLSVWINCWR